MTDLPLSPEEFAEVLRARGIDAPVIVEVVDAYHAHVVAASRAAGDER